MIIAFGHDGNNDGIEIRKVARFEKAQFVFAEKLLPERGRPVRMSEANNFGL